jgi:hypothetical protein
VQTDGIYYLLDVEKCIKIHFHNKKPYFDIRRYQKDEKTGKITTVWMPENTPCPEEMIKRINELKEKANLKDIESSIILQDVQQRLYPNRKASVVKGSGISLT